MTDTSEIARSSRKDVEASSRRAYSAIRDSIVSLELAPGSLLSENSLGVWLGLSRTPIREALKRLEREYLVEIMPARGIMVTKVDLESQLQLLEMRRGIESRLIARGTERATPEQKAEFGRLADVAEAFAETGDLASYIACDTKFDAQIDKAAANRFLTDAIRPVHALVRRFWHTQHGTAGLKEALRRHARVIRCAAEGDVGRLSSVLADVYDFQESYILDRLS